MPFLNFINFIFLIILGSLIIFLKITKSEGLLSIGKENLTGQIFCPNRVNNIVTLQTVVNRNDLGNDYVVDQVSVIVYYRCPAYFANSLLRDGQLYSFQKICDQEAIQCDGGDDSCKSRSLGDPPTVTVNLNLLNDVKNLRLMTIRCSEEPAVFRLFSNNSFVDFSDVTTHVFSINNTRKDIRLAVSQMIKTNVLNIQFKIAKSKCTFGFHKESTDILGYKCYIRLDGLSMEGGYKNWQCNNDDVMGNYSGNDLCGFYAANNMKLCHNRCFNLPGCNYLCASDRGGELIEDNIFIGGRNPSGLVDECKYNIRICELGNKYCVDATTSYTCTTGDYNMKNCFIGKSKYPHWKCPVTMAAFKSPGLLQVPENAILFKKDIMNVFQNKSEKKEDIKLMYNILEKLAPNKTVVSFNLPVQEKSNLAGFLVNRLADDFMAYSTKNNKTAFESESLIFSSVKMNSSDPESAIPILPPDEKGDSQGFIKLQVHRPNLTNTANLLLFKGLDVMDENSAVKSTIKLLKENASPDYSDDEDTLLYKNSDMFSLKVDRGVDNVKTVKYKLNTTEEVGESTSWMYEVEHACGILDNTKNWSWTQSGCKLVTSNGESMCECEHLSNFAMLISVKRINVKHLRILHVLSVIGALINAFSLLFFVIFVLVINSRDKLRLDLLNIALCLLLATITFMFGSLFVKLPGLCAAVAMITEFFFLAAFVWKLILGINVFGVLVLSMHYNEQWMTKYRWVLVGVGYGVPLLIVIIFGASCPHQYREVAGNVCWMIAPSKAFLSFLIPISFILAVNTIGIFAIAGTLIHNHIKTRDIKIKKVNRELVVFVQLVVSMGLTWFPTYFAVVYLSAMYMFVLLFPLQGLLMFLLVVVIPRNNRDKVSSFFNERISTIRSSLLIDKSSKDRRNISETTKEIEERDKLLYVPETSKSKVEISL